MSEESPQPIMRGKFAIYETPDGGRLLAYQPEGENETSRFVIPAVIMRLIESQQRGEKINPMQLMKTMMGL